MNLISADELKVKLDTGDEFKLVMVSSQWAFRRVHIPGSLHIDHPSKAAELLDPADEIVLYSPGPSSPSSKYAYQFLTAGGYKNVHRYAGGITDWEDGGLPLEGEWPE